MQPHPILMHTLHDDRNRELKAALTRRHVNHAYDELTASEPRHPIVERVLALLVPTWRLSRGKASSARA
jgi:hypothetical protein